MVSRRTFWEICYTFLHFFGTLFLHFFWDTDKSLSQYWKRCSRRTSFWETCLHFFTLFGTLFLHFFGTPTKVCLRTGNGVAGGAPHTTAMPTLPVPHWPRCPYFFPLHFVIFPFLSFGNISIYFAICCF